MKMHHFSPLKSAEILSNLLRDYEHRVIKTKVDAEEFLPAFMFMSISKYR